VRVRYRLTYGIAPVMAGVVFGIGAVAVAPGERFLGALDLTLTPFSPSSPVLCTRMAQAPTGVEVRQDDALFAGVLNWFTRHGEFQMRVL